MKAFIAMAMAVAVSVNAATAFAAGPQDKMASYRKLANLSMQAFEAHEGPTAKKIAQQLEKAWDKGEKELKKKSPEVWEPIDTAMDAFVKPLTKEESPDWFKVARAYDALIAKLELAAR